MVVNRPSPFCLLNSCFVYRSFNLFVLVFFFFVSTRFNLLSCCSFTHSYRYINTPSQSRTHICGAIKMSNEHTSLAPRVQIGYKGESSCTHTLDDLPPFFSQGYIDLGLAENRLCQDITTEKVSTFQFAS